MTKSVVIVLILFLVFCGILGEFGSVFLKKWSFQKVHNEKMFFSKN